MLKLELISGPQKGRMVRVSDDAPVPIGRNFGRLRLHDSRVSKHHAEIIYGGNGSWVLRDLGSSNGSYVNQEKLTTLAELEQGDTIQFGRIVIRVREADHKDVHSVAPEPTVDEPASPLAAFAEDSIFTDAPLTTAPPADAGAGGADAALDLDASDADGDIDLDALFAEADRADGWGEEDDGAGMTGLVDEDGKLAVDAEDDRPLGEPVVIDAPGVETPDVVEEAADDMAAAQPAADDADADSKPGDDADTQPAGLDDQIQIDDDLPDAGKMPGTTMVLASDTLAAAAGSDRSTPPPALDHEAATPGPQDADTDDAIGLAQEPEGGPSVFDQATDPETPADDSAAHAPPAHDQDLIRIGDDAPIAPPTEEALAQDAPVEAQAQSEADAPSEAVVEVEAEAEVEVEVEDEPEATAQAPADAAPEIHESDDAPLDTGAALENDADPEQATGAPPAVATDDADEVDFGLADFADEDLGHSSGSWLIAAAPPTPDILHPGETTEPIAEVEDETETQADAEAVDDTAEKLVWDVQDEPVLEGTDDTPADEEANTTQAEDAEDDTHAQTGEPAFAVELPGAAEEVDDEARDTGDDAAQGLVVDEVESPIEDEAEDPAGAEDIPAHAPVDEVETHTDTEGPADIDTADDVAPVAATDTPTTPHNVSYLRAALAHLVDSEPPAPAAEPSPAPEVLRAALAQDVAPTDSAPATPTDDTDADLASLDEDPAAPTQGKDPAATDFDAPAPADIDAPLGSADAIADELARDERDEQDALRARNAPFPGQSISAAPTDLDDDFGSHLGTPALNPTTTLPPGEPRTSRRSIPDWGHRTAKRRTAAIVGGLLLILLGAGLYVGIFNPDLIAGRGDDNTEPTPGTTPTHSGPGQTTPNDVSPRIPNNPGPQDPETDTPGSTPPDPGAGLYPPPTNPYLSQIDPANNGNDNTPGGTQTPDPFATLARVIGADALAGRTTDDPAVARPNTQTPDPEDNTNTQAATNPGDPLPPITLPDPGGSTTPGVEPMPEPEPVPTVDPTDPADPVDPPALPFDPNAPTDGERLVFLVDCSGSMVDSLPQMLVWLRQAIDTLEPQQRFTIVFFKKDRAIEPEPAGLRPFTRATQRALESEWLDPDAAPVLPSGRSDPDRALQLALTYEPTDIYILSDESFGLRTGDTTTEQALALITDAIGDNELRVHGVQFFYDDNDGTLESLAEFYGGTYEFVAEARHPDRDPIDLLEELENRNP